MSKFNDQGAARAILMLTFRRRFPRVFASAACLLVFVLAPGWAASGARPQPPVRLLGKADALPLAIDPDFQIRKTKTYFLETQEVTGIRNAGNSEDQSITFERRYLTWGAINGSDIRDRYGNYFTFFWRAKRHANLTVRLEYRQQKLGAFVQAREVDYPDAHGNYATSFAVNGDDYIEQGRVSAWRLIIIENHEKIVALKQSYLWR